MPVLAALLLSLLNLLWLFLVVLGLPGNWLMVLTAAGAAWWWREGAPYTLWTLGALALLALLGEVVEFLSASAGARRGGASRWGSAGALLGGLAGGLAGTFLVPVPVVGSILGACAGAFAGALGFEVLAGRRLGESLRAGGGAARGRFLGTLGKLAAGVAIWTVATAAAFVP